MTGKNHLLDKNIARAIGKAIFDFSMIQESDKILVGLSGGKDSGLLLYALRRLQLRSPVRFGLSALTVDPTDEGLDLSVLTAFAKSLGVEHRCVRYPLFSILKSGVSESACSLCANIRRGILASSAKEMDCNVLALGHHCDDAVETVWLNLLFAGRFRCFHPHMTMSRSGVRVIRPMIYVRETEIMREAKRRDLPLVDFSCLYSADSRRAVVKEKIKDFSQIAPDMVGNVIHALKNCRESDVWFPEEVLR